MASSDDSDKPTDGNNGQGSGLPAHLQLPNMDFSLPPMPGGDNAGNQFSGEVNTRMDLPQFPNLDASGADGSPPTLGASGGPPPPRRSKAGGGGPPAPPPRRGGGKPKDDLSLPDFGEPPKKKKLTLISAQVPSSVLNDNGKRSILPMVAGVLVVVAVGAAVVAREPLMAMISPKAVEAPKPPPLTPEQLAKKAYAFGVNSYVAKDFPKAIEYFDKALDLDPKFGKAHRDLGVVYATLHEQAKAVDHYRSYLELTPKAEDAVEVQKIIDDYAKAQVQPEPASAAPEADKPVPAQKNAKKAKVKKKGKH